MDKFVVSSCKDVLRAKTLFTAMSTDVSINTTFFWHIHFMRKNSMLRSDCTEQISGDALLVSFWLRG